MPNKLSLSTIVTVATLSISAMTQSAQAASVINNTGISSPDQVITFSEFSFPTATVITNQFLSLGASFINAIAFYGNVITLKHGCYFADKLIANRVNYKIMWTVFCFSDRLKRTPLSIRVIKR